MQWINALQNSQRAVTVTCHRRPVHFANAFVAVFWSQWTASSSASWRASSPPANFVYMRAVVDDVRHRLPLSALTQVRLSHAPTMEAGTAGTVACSELVQRVHGWRGRSKSGGRTAGSRTRPWLTTEADTQASLHRSSVTPVVSTDHMGYDINTCRQKQLHLHCTHPYLIHR